MFLSLGLVILGFVLGVVVTGIFAAMIVSAIHAEAVKAMDSYGAVLFFSDARTAAPPPLKADLR